MPDLDARVLTYTAAGLDLCRPPAWAVSKVSKTRACTSNDEIPALLAKAPLVQLLALGSAGGAKISPFFHLRELWS